ncbi:cytochrome P450 [Thozetella sp. PMI_491]|nr:cytochrome P450 [Thozetella sp. PMI_491]
MVISLIFHLLYSVFLHVLHLYPGPTFSAISRIPYWIACLHGNQVRWMAKLHQKHGPVVRYGPNDMSYSDGRAWKDITTVKRITENGKQATFYPPSTNGIPSIFAEPNIIRHAELRRIFSHAFSERALKAQEPLFQKHTDLLVAYARKAKTVNLTELFNFITFDIVGEMAFGHSLGQLECGKYTPWMAKIFRTLRVLPFLQMIHYYPLVQTIFDLIEPKFVTAMRSDFQHTTSRVDKRICESSEKSDMWNLILEDGTLSLDEIYINAELFMTAGTETTASLLTGLMYYLIASPDKKRILTNEIRQRFHNDREITFVGLAQIDYLNACIREGLRVWPPVPVGLPREIAPGGNHILGRWLPGGTSVSKHSRATTKNTEIRRNPDKFAPERWLGDPEYKDDQRDAHQLFSLGPRNCLGMNIAWHEARLLIAKLLFNFDIESDVGPDWTDQNVYVIWERKPLKCQLKEVSGSYKF